LHKEALKTYTAKDLDLRKYELSSAEWDNLALVADWLGIFREATTLMSTTKYPMISSVHAVFNGLQKTTKKMIADLPPRTSTELRNGLVNAHNKLAVYYSKFDDSKYYFWAARKCYMFISISF
jgi:subtilase family serine protease